jgi:hypothetical protein
MKLMSFTVPMLIISLTVVAVWGVGMLAIRASAVSTQTSIELLRMHLRVERLHEQLLHHSREAVAAHVEALLRESAGPAADGAEPPAEEAGQARPWPSAEPAATPETLPPLNPAAAAAAAAPLEAGLRHAQPALHRLLDRLHRALPIP